MSRAAAPAGVGGQAGRQPVSLPGARALKPWLPAIHMGRSGRFYLDLGFACRWSTAEKAEYACGPVAFILHHDYMAVVAENTVMRLEVDDVEAWWRHAHDQRLNDVHDVKLGAVSWHNGEGRFTLTDPAGVLWQIVQPAPAD